VIFSPKKKSRKITTFYVIHAASSLVPYAALLIQKMQNKAHGKDISYIFYMIQCCISTTCLFSITYWIERSRESREKQKSEASHNFFLISFRFQLCYIFFLNTNNSYAYTFSIRFLSPFYLFILCLFFFILSKKRVLTFGFSDWLICLGLINFL